jgi:putative hydrolase of the HAD superfamily
MESTSPAAGIRALVLDYGEVVCDRPAPDRIARMATASGLDTGTFAASYDRERAAYDRGDVTPAEYWSRVIGSATAAHDDLIARLREWDVEIWSDVNRRMIDWLDRARAAGFKTALLSNMHPDMAAHARRSFDWLRRLDCGILSCEIHRLKPGRAIYERCLEQLAVPPSEALFIDNCEANVAGAREAGMLGLRFESVGRLRDDLAAMGFPVLP